MQYMYSKQIILSVLFLLISFCLKSFFPVEYRSFVTFSSFILVLQINWQYYVHKRLFKLGVSFQLFHLAYAFLSTFAPIIAKVKHVTYQNVH